MTVSTKDKLDTEAPVVPARGRRRLLLALVWGAALSLVLLCGVLLALYGPLGRSRAAKSATVHLLTPGAEETPRVTIGTDFTPPEPEALENYRFLGWRAEDGQLLNGKALTVKGELYLAAEYAVKLRADDALPLLFCDEQARYRPFDPLTRAECAELLASLLAAEVVPGEGFSDLKDGACAQAAARLQTLGVFSGKRFYPEKSLTRGEFLQILAKFYPAARSEYRFSDLKSSEAAYPAFCVAAEQGWIQSGEDVAAAPNAVLRRVDAAQILNRLLGRRYESGEYYVDELSEGDPLYREIVMAAGSLASKKPPPNIVLDGVELGNLEPGLHLEGIVLFCVTEEHELLRNGSFGSFQFDGEGHYTSGDEELDELMFPLLHEICDGLDSREDMLRAIYDYLMKTIRYRKGSIYGVGDNSWTIVEAKRTFTTWWGNCYNYTGAFCELSRAIGYDTKVYCGSIGYPQSRHAWAEIEFDGVPYLYDPEMQATYHQFKDTEIDMYHITREQAASKGWAYQYPPENS